MCAACKNHAYQHKCSHTNKISKPDKKKQILGRIRDEQVTLPNTSLRCMSVVLLLMNAHTKTNFPD